MGLRTISVCSGFGGLDLGFHAAIRRLGGDSRTICHIERELYCIAGLAARMEEGYLDPAPIWSDLATFDGGKLRGKVDGLLTSVPCQSLSKAGKQRGIDDERWLWPHVVRIIDQCEPWFIFFENVAGILTTQDGEPLAAIKRDLEARGFILQADLVGAADVGAPHLRKRFFMLAIRRELANHEGLFGDGGDHHEGIRERSTTVPEFGDNRGSVATGELHVSDGDGRDDEAGEPAQGGAGDAGERRLPGRQSGEPHRDLASRGPKAVEQHDGIGTFPKETVEGREGEFRVRRQDFDAMPEIPRGEGFPGLFCPGAGEADFGAWADVLAARPWLAPAIPKATESDIRRKSHGLADGLERSRRNRVPRLMALGNGVVPLCASIAFLWLWEMHLNGDPLLDDAEEWL